MLCASLSKIVDPPWTTMQPLRLGKIPPGLGTPNIFVTITDNDTPVLRVDIYADDGVLPFQDTTVRSDRVFIGYRYQLFIVDIRMRSGTVINLGSCFSSFRVAQDSILVLSGERLFRIGADGVLLWESPILGMDGVRVLNVDTVLIQGEGDWDPTGNWKPFSIRLDSGKPYQNDMSCSG